MILSKVRGATIRAAPCGFSRRLPQNLGQKHLLMKRWTGTSKVPTETPPFTSSLGVIGSRPPFSVRALLVGTSVGLGTPLFATMGVAVAFHRVLPKEPLVQGLVFLCCGGGLGTVLYNYVGPFLAQHSEVVLPFAAANGCAAMFWYGVLEAQVGLDAMAGSIEALMGGSSAAAAAATVSASKGTKGASGGGSWWLNSGWSRTMFRYGVPFGGPAVGVLTAVTAGYLYPVSHHSEALTSLVPWVHSSPSPLPHGHR
jgi:hypothetical protein